eukprot:scaffold91094_cov75-Cyclotella_meneghiniana.AAC.3
MVPSRKRIPYYVFSIPQNKILVSTRDGHKKSIRPPLYGVMGVPKGHTSDLSGHNETFCVRMAAYCVRNQRFVTGSSEANSLYVYWLKWGHGVKNGRSDSLRSGLTLFLCPPLGFQQEYKQQKEGWHPS